MSMHRDRFGQKARQGALYLLTWAVLSTLPASAAVIANSVTDFSSTQGQAGWTYGFFDAGMPPATAYTTGGFVEFDTFDVPANRWEASAAQVGANNNQFLNIGDQGGHPAGIGPSGQDSIIWAVRRYTSPVDGLLNIAYDLRKFNVQEPRGGGITGRIFVDGVEVFTQVIANDDGTGIQAALLQLVTTGTVIDFVIDPTGVQPSTVADGPFSARADGTVFSAVISTTDIPEPSAFVLLGLGLIAAARRRRR